MDEAGLSNSKGFSVVDEWESPKLGGNLRLLNAHCQSAEGGYQRILHAFTNASNLAIIQVLALGSHVTPTDPAFSPIIVKGNFADKKAVQQITITESGANDSLNYRFLVPAHMSSSEYISVGLTAHGGAGKIYWAAHSACWYNMTPRSLADRPSRQPMIIMTRSLYPHHMPATSTCSAVHPPIE
ncbi:hypothetical protein B0J13DRAFT_534295 [Dactylonectria estremocensis]|uniref:Uncharacterized protein n=1 Tax=Dactylonectria estremocensis TaxID=1079267 RepID=A0A9P9I9A2_9HYPO|nr:hypothetical protein B0J13DRAFT_534295 [Dactylonectria estremocensis]